jgi:hypothetical protein
MFIVTLHPCVETYNNCQDLQDSDPNCSTNRDRTSPCLQSQHVLDVIDVLTMSKLLRFETGAETETQDRDRDIHA